MTERKQEGEKERKSSARGIYLLEESIQFEFGIVPWVLGKGKDSRFRPFQVLFIC